MPANDTPIDLLPDKVRAEAAVAFRDLASGLYTVSGAANVGKKSLWPLQLYAKTGDSLVKKIKNLDNKIKSVEKAADFLDSKPLVGPIAKALKPLASGLEKWSANTKVELLNLSETQRNIGKVVEPVVDALGKIDKFALAAGAASDVYSRKLAVAGQQLAEAKQLFDTDIPFFGNDSARLKQKALLLFASAQLKSAEAAVSVTQIQIEIDGIQDALGELSAFAENPIFQSIEDFQEAITTIGNTLSQIFDPISQVTEKLGPVLDALDSVFGWALAPLEWALETVIEETGINNLIESVSEELLSFLPDTGVLDGIIAELERLFLQEFKDFYEQQVEAPFNEVREKLEDATFPNQFAVPTEGDDALMGALYADGALNIDALGGDDILLGSEYGDTLLGGAGSDILIGGGGDDLLDGGTNPGTDPDFALYTGSITDYGIVSVLENGFASGTWFITDLRNDTSIEGVSYRINLGTDELRGIEVLVFDDDVLDLRDIDTFIQTHSAEGETVEVTPTATTLLVNNIPVYTSDVGIDLIFGDVGLDVLDTGAGNDQLNSATNAPLTEELLRAGDILEGGLGNDNYIIGPRSGNTDIIYDEGGNDTAVYRNSEFGITVFLGSTARELTYRPVSVFIDADPEGHLLPILDYRVGQVFGIENLTGSQFDDILIGSDLVNKINGGAGNDQIRGLDGDDILLGGDGNDILIGDGGNDYLEGGSGSNVYVGGLGDDYIVDLSSSFSRVFYAVTASTDHYSQSIDFVDFTTTGDSVFNNHDMPGGIVIVPSSSPGKQQVSKYATSVVVGDRNGIDYLEGVEIVVASTGRDVIYTAAGINQIIYGNDGDDDLFTDVGSTENTIYGGPGDDLFISDFNAEDTFFGGADSDLVRVWGTNGVAGDLLFGDDSRQTPLPGIDTLDFSQSDFSWHIYLNPFASSGSLTGKAPLTALFDEDPRFIQPTLGVNGVVPKLPGVVVPGEVYPGINHYLREADPNTSDPGGRADNLGEFERIIGSQNRDFISGGSPDGPVTIDGQGGDDVLYASQRFAAIISGGEGNDVLGTFNDTYGTEDTLNFFDPSQWTLLSGGSGNDTFVAGDFQERFDGGDGIDLLTYEASTSGVTVDLTTELLDRGYATGDILIGGIINVTGSQFDDLITGDGMNNQLVGWDGADSLHGQDGNDQLFGNDGDDQLFGGLGADVLHGGNGADLLDGGEGTDTATWNLFQVHPKGNLSRLTNDTSGVVADLVTGEAGLDTLVGIENLSGGVGDDQFFGDAGDNFLGGNAGDDLLDGRGGHDVILGSQGDDTLLGGDGNDFLSGGAGNNTIDGGEGIDTIDYSSLIYGVTIVMAGAGTRSGLTTGEVDSLTAVDAYVWTDSLTMVAGPTGLPGDLIETGTSEVRYTYQTLDLGTEDPSDDILVQEDPITPERIWKLNPLFAEEPADLVEVRYLPDEGLLPEQEVSVVQEYVASRDIFSSIERIIGGKGNDSIVGNSEDSFFYGGPGADTIDGGDGSDTAGYQYSEQAVTVDLTNLVFEGGEAEGDMLENIENLIGSSFADVLVGNASDNRLTPGAGNDSVTGGNGTDTVVFEFASTDFIYELISGGLQVIYFKDATIRSEDTVADDIEFLEFTDTTLSYAEASATTGLTVIGGPGDDMLEGDFGNDTLVGNGGRDTLQGFAGNDTLDGGADIDHALFQHDLLDYTLVNDSGQIQVVGPIEDGEDTLTDVERLHFADTSLAFDLDGNAGTIARLLGVVLGRENWYNKELMGIGLDIIDNNAIDKSTLMNLAFDAILGSNPSNSAVVELIYSNLVGQAPSPEALSTLTTELLDSGALTQGSLGALALDHEINEANIDLVLLAENGVQYFLLV